MSVWAGLRLRVSAGVCATAGVLLFLLAIPFPILCDARETGQTSDVPVVTLDQCVAQALKAGPDIRLSRIAVEVARAQYTASAAENGVSLEGNASVSHSNSTSSTISRYSGRDSTPLDSVNAGMSLTAPLGSRVDVSASHQIAETSPLIQFSSLSASASATFWDGYPGGSGLASVREAAYSLQVTRLSEEAGRATVIYEVKQAYYTALGRQRELDILTRTLEQRREELKKTQLLHDSGNASLIDLRQARVNLSSAELDLRKAQGLLEVDRENLSILAGWPVEKVYAVAEADDLSAPIMDVAEAATMALSRRADMREAALHIASGEIGVALARAKGSPTVSASAGCDLSQSWSIDGSLNLGWSASVQVGMPILDAGATAAAVREARLKNESLVVQRDKLAATIATKVKDAVYSLRDLVARVELARAGVELAESQYELARMQFESGTGSNLDVLDASVALATARVAHAKARGDAQLGVLALQDALGM